MTFQPGQSGNNSGGYKARKPSTDSLARLVWVQMQSNQQEFAGKSLVSTTCEQFDATEQSDSQSET